MAEQIALEEPPLAQDQRAAARDQQFAALVGRQARFVFRVAYSILRNVEDADDVVQETFLKLYRSASWGRIENEKAFLARAAWRLAIDHLRKAARNAPARDQSWAGADPERAAIAADLGAAVGRLIDNLPEELRQPLALSSVERMNSREIAEMMGIPEGTVRTRLMRARQILKQKLRALGAVGHEG